MKELISDFIRKSIADSTNNELFLKKNEFIFVKLEYIRFLENVFSMPTEELVNILSESVNEFIFFSESIVESLGDLESIADDKEEFLKLVKSIIDVVIEIKVESASKQIYDRAAAYRDIEIDLKRIYFPELIKPNNPKNLSLYLKQKRD